jgi:NAD+ kinase
LNYYLILKSAGIILRPSSPELKEIYLKIKELFQKADIEILLEDNSANMISLKGIPLDDLCRKVDFLISVGGDGTLLSVLENLLNMINLFWNKSWNFRIFN